MRYRIYLGRSADGKSAGFLELFTNGVPNASLATPDALKLVGLRGVDCVRDSATGQLRQIMAAESFGTVTPVDGHAYNIAFYRPSSVAPDLDTNGWYVLKPGAISFVDYQIRNPDTTNAFERLQIVQTRDGAAKTEEFSWATDAQGRLNWGLSEGNDLKRIGLCVEPVGGNETAKTWTTRAQDGTVDSVQQKRYISLGGELRLTQKIEDPDGAALRTQVAYVTNAALASYGAIAQTINPDGSWGTNVFNADGVICEERSGWLDAGPGASAGASTVTAYDYAPFLEQVESNVVDTVISTNEQSVVVTNFIYNVETNFWPDTGATDGGTPRVETVTAAGVPVAKTLRVIYTDTMGYKTVEEVRLLDPSRTDHAAAYADPANPRTVTQYMPKSDTYSWSERPEYTCHPDGQTESYAFLYGNYAVGEAGVPGVFTESPVTGAFMQVTCTHGTTNAPGGVASQTTREVTIETSVGRVLQSETWLYAGETNFTRVAWRKNTLNDLGQTIATYDSAGAETETTWGCCGPESQTAADGTVTETAYDALKRPVLTTREGEGAQPDLFTETAYDAAGRVTFRRTFSGGLSQSTTNTYDLAGRLIWSRGPDGVEITYVYGSNSTTTVRGGLTNTTVRFADGRAHYTEQNGIRQQTHAYGVNPDGSQWTLTAQGALPAELANTLELPNFSTLELLDFPWEIGITEPLGRTIAEIRPGYGGTLLVTSNFYDSANHLLCQTVADATNPENPVILSRTLYQYDSLGNPLLTCQDLDLDGQIDLAGPDRVTGQATRYWYGDAGVPSRSLGEGWHQESASWTYPDSGFSIPLTNSIARTRLTGLGGAYSADGATGLLAAESVSIDARGNQTVSRTVVDRAGKTVYQITDTPDSSVAALTVTVNGLVQSSRSAHNLTTTYVYDALGRQVAVQDARGAVHSRGYDDLGRVAWESDPATNGTWYAYDALGRRTAVTNALGHVTHTAYDLEGRTIAIWGATYPVAYEYDAHGRMTAMATTRDNGLEGSLLALLPAGVHLSQVSHPSYPAALDTTRWYYDAPTGLLTNKLYADGKGTAYSYTPDGKLETRNWARGVTTTYAYDLSGSLTNIVYSDSTPDVAFAYDRLGRQVSAIVAGVSTNLYSYTLLGQLANETVSLCASAPLSETISRSYDALGRPAGIALSNSPYDVSYAYDAYGRFIAVTAQVHVLTHRFTYGYLAGSDLVETMANSHGHTATRTYDPVLPNITRVHNGFTGGRTISQYDYTYDSLGRRTAIASSGEAFTFSNANDLAAFNLYGYNTRSEVTSAARYWGTDTGDTSAAVDGQQYAYAFDPIGNRITAADGDTSRTATYTANELNQYSQRTVPGVKELAGTALADATVTVNELPTDRYGPWWRHAFAVDNGSSAAYTQAVVTAIYNPPGTNEADVVSSSTGHVFVAETPEAFTYDDDGNLLSDGRFTYSWDAENRLITATTRDNLPADLPRVRVTHHYDHRSRRIATARETWSGTAWQSAGTNRYLYDGWNVVAEVRAASPANTNLNVWGLDLSGSLQGAGGIGGLLTVRKRLEDGTGIVRNYDYLFDANGNVVQETFRTDGAINAHYEYDPFGNTVVALRVDATDNPFRFSTKWFDNDTGLGYWGYRWYGPGLGRWMSRDPIGERGGLSELMFARNRPISLHDAFGLCSDTEAPSSWSTGDSLVKSWTDCTVANVTMLIEKDSGCAKQGCWRLRLDEIRMQITVKNCNPSTIKHEQKHVNDLRRISCGDTKRYARSKEGCYSLEKAQCWKKVVEVEAAEAFYWLGKAWTVAFVDLTEYPNNEFYHEQWKWLDEQYAKARTAMRNAESMCSAMQ